ncbi:MAG: acetyl-CoA C-acyltransferase [Deltaproteobacteria bacterium]|nr:acetyl-CoA C-acyltransferase [Deltaproteobacteria bacterium]MBM4324133.1 acetyl-CoA C-acyltransferase [Deltaproteobacteria bacterium]
MKRAVIVSAVRTPIGRYMGMLKDISAYDLGTLVLNEVIRRVGLDPGQVDEVILGQAYQNGEYVNIARMSLLKAGWPEKIPGITLDRRCCTGLDVICSAAMAVQSGHAEIIVAGGVESMSNAEFYLPGEVKWGIGGKKGIPRGHGDLSLWGIPLYDRIQRARVMSQPEERYGILPSMMSWAETAAKEEKILREDCDSWALESHRKACAAMETGKFREEIVPVPVFQGKGKVSLIDQDETPRFDTTLEQLSKLSPVLGGVCTAGNSSSENDGAAACVVMAEEKAKALGLKPLASIKEFAVAGVDPRFTYQAVDHAVRKVLERTGLKIDQIDLIEIQEAFAAQVLADLKLLKISQKDYSRINVNGSGISLGHPIACTGTRVMVTLLHEMKRRGSRYGLETICGGGGLGIAAIFERQ